MIHTAMCDMLGVFFCVFDVCRGLVMLRYFLCLLALCFVVLSIQRQHRIKLSEIVIVLVTSVLILS